MFSSIVIAYPLVLLLVFPCVIGLYFLFRTQEQGCIAPNHLFLRYIRKSKLLLLSRFLTVLIGVLLIFILSSPSYRTVLTVEKPSEHSIMLVLDISKSMLAEDITPNRMLRAKEILDTYIDSLDDERIGIIVFAGKPFVLSPPTTDYTGLRYLLSSLTPDTINQDIPGLSGTAIGDALLSANSFYSGGTATGVIIFMTDGTYNIGLNPRIALQETKNLSVPLYVVGIGDPSGIPLYTTNAKGEKEYFYDSAGNTINANLDEQLMRDMALGTGGYYFLARDTESFEEVFRDIGNLSRSEAQYEERETLYDMSPLLALVTLILLSIRGYVGSLYRARYNLL